ncbi:MAG: adenylate kinase family protein [Methanobacteriaceae archaeon]
MKNKVVLITGTPGVGKTTVANEISNSQELNSFFNINIISVNDIADKNNLFSGIDKDKNYKIIDPEILSDFFKANINDIINDSNNNNNNANSNTNTNTNANTTNNINNNNNNANANNKSNINNNYDNNEKPKLIIIEGHLSHFCPICDYVIVIRVHPTVLEKRLSDRNYSDEKIQENLESEALGVCSVEAYELHNDKVNEIDASNMNITTIINEINNVTTGKASYPIGDIDYIDWFMK